MELTQIVSIVTIIITWLLGILSKKSTFINNKLIPIQNVLIGVIVAVIEWIVTKDFSTAIALSGLIAGGSYDIFHNLEKNSKRRIIMNIIKQIVPESKYGIKCPYVMTPEYITVHNTANDASAKNEINYMINNNNEISFHLAVDDKEIIQGIPFNRNSWNAGDGGNGTGNRKSISIEICYSKSGGDRFTKAEQNAVELIVYLLKKYGWGIDRVKKHQDWSGKYCPHRTLDMGWDRFIKMIEAKLVSEKYTLVVDVPVYMSAKDAVNGVNPVKTYIAGEYFVFNKSQNMINITKIEGKAGGWINPKDNVVPITPVPEVPNNTAEEPKVEAEVITPPVEETIENKEEIDVTEEYSNRTETNNPLLWLIQVIVDFIRKIFKR